jgi:hypothetical protein
MSPETARSPSTPVFAFGDEARATGRRRRPRAAHDGFTSGARSEDEDGDFELESFPLTSLALGPWHARAHVSLRLAFGSGRLVFVVVRRLRAKKASAFGRTAELVTRHVARRLRVDVPMSPFDPEARGRRMSKGGERATKTSYGENDEDEDANADVSDDERVFFAKQNETASSFAERARDDVSVLNSLRKERLKKRPPPSTRKTRPRRALVLTYEIDHDDIVGLNYVNQLCLDGRLAIETRKVTKRAFDALDDALAFFAAKTTTTDSSSVSGPSDSVDGRRRIASAAGVGRAGARRHGRMKEKNAFASPTFSARKRSRFAADVSYEFAADVSYEQLVSDEPLWRTAKARPSDGAFDVLDASSTSDAPSPRTPPRDDERVLGKNVHPETSKEDSLCEKKKKPARVGLHARPFAYLLSRRRVVKESVSDTSTNSCAERNADDGHESEVFRDQTVFASFDDLFLPEALRLRVVAERRLLTLAEDGIPVWATVMASCGLYYRPWLRTAARAAFIALALVSAAAGARDFFALGARGVADADVAPASSSASSSANTLFLGGLAWTGGARLGLVDARAIRTLTGVLNAAARALIRVGTFVGYVVGRIFSHRLSLLMAARRAWRGLPGLWANAHGFRAPSEKEPSSPVTATCASDRDEKKTTRNTSEKSRGGDFRLSAAVPRARKNKTPARGVSTSRADESSFTLSMMCRT